MIPITCSVIQAACRSSASRHEFTSMVIGCGRVT
jgi:hypothetical protein